MSKRKKTRLKYFLDHPQIKRKPSPGNGQAPIETNDGGGGQKVDVKPEGRMDRHTKPEN